MTALAYQLLEHTADIRVRITAATRKELFLNAAKTLFDLAIVLPAVLPKTRRSIAIALKAGGREELFVAWLNELISLSAAREIGFFCFRIKGLTEKSLDAFVFGVPITACAIKTEIKAATFHQLKVARTKGKWIAEVVFDV